MVSAPPCPARSPKDKQIFPAGTPFWTGQHGLTNQYACRWPEPISPTSRPCGRIKCISGHAARRSKRQPLYHRFMAPMCIQFWRSRLPMNLDFNRTQPVLVYWLNSQLVVTTAIILTCSPGKKEQRPYASLYAVVRRTNPVACALWFRGSMRKFVGGSLTPGEGETVPVTLINRAFGWLKTGPRSNCESNCHSGTFHNFQTGSE